MRKLLFAAILLLSLNASGQRRNGLDWDNYYFTGNMLIGSGGKFWAPSSVWLQIGQDSTTKGLVLPRVVSTAAITSPVKGMVVYSYYDAGIRIYDGSSWVSTGVVTETDPLSPRTQRFLDSVLAVRTTIIANTTALGLRFAQGGNSFAATAVFGTLDANILQIITNGTVRVTVDASGVVTFAQLVTCNSSIGITSMISRAGTIGQGRVAFDDSSKATIITRSLDGAYPCLRVLQLGGAAATGDIAQFGHGLDTLRVTANASLFTPPPIGAAAARVRFGAIEEGSDHNPYWHIEINGVPYYIRAFSTLP